MTVLMFLICRVYEDVENADFTCNWPVQLDKKRVLIDYPLWN